MGWSDRVPVSTIVGLTMTSVEVNEANDEIVFTSTDGRTFLMCHRQDCCEGVSIESIVGDLADLVGEPILVAEEVSSEGVPAKQESYPAESFTWTFYKFATRKGYVDVRWYGESNGYYSEEVDFEETTAQE